MSRIEAHTHTVCVYTVNSGGAHGEKVVSILRDSLAFIINGGGNEGCAAKEKKKKRVLCVVPSQLTV